MLRGSREVRRQITGPDHGTPQTDQQEERMYAGFQGLFDSCSHPALLFDRIKQTVRSANAAAVDFLEASQKADLCGISLATLLDPDAAHTLELMLKQKSDCAHFLLRWSFRTLKQHTRPVKGIYFDLKTQEQHPAPRTVLIWCPAEQYAESALEKHRPVLQHGTWMFTGSGIQLDEQAATLLGFPQNTFSLTHIYRLVFRWDRPRFRTWLSQLAQAAASPESIPGQVLPSFKGRLHTARGYRWVFLSAQAESTPPWDAASAVITGLVLDRHNARQQQRHEARSPDELISILNGPYTTQPTTNRRWHQIWPESSDDLSNNYDLLKPMQSGNLTTQPTGSDRPHSDFQPTFVNIESIAQNVHQIGHFVLSPPAETFNLLTQLERYCTALNTQTAMVFDLVVTEYEPDLPPALQFQAFRLLQDISTATLEQAEATHALFYLTVRDHTLVLTVEADGGARDLDRFRLKDRIHPLNGRLDLEVIPGSGIYIQIELPLA